MYFSGASDQRRLWQTVGLFGFLLFLSFRPMTDPDIWFYLVQGREIASTGAIPPTEFYIFPALGEPATYSAIGFGVLYFFVHQAGGYLGMALVNALFAALAITLCVRAARSDEDTATHFHAGLIAGVVVYLLAEFRFVYRPENLLFVFIGAELIVLEDWLRRGTTWRLVALPLLIGALSWFHTSAVLLLVIFACYLAQYVWDQIRHSKAPPIRELAILSGIVSLLALIPLLNPNGREQFLIILRGLFAFNSDLVEYLPALKTEYRWNFICTVVLAVLSLGLAPKQRVADWLLLTAFGAVAFLYARNIGLFAIITALPLTKALQNLAVRKHRSLSLPRLRLVTGVIVLSVSTWTFGAHRWGIGPDTETVFLRSAAMIRTVSDGENIMNFFDHGSYLAWELGPAFKVAIDGHFVRASAAPGFHDQVMRADPGWTTLLSQYDVRFILTPATLPYSGTLIPLVKILAEMDEWQLINVEPAGLMFARQDVAEKWPAMPKVEVWNQASRELRALLDTYPDNASARASLTEVAKRQASQGGAHGSH